MSSLDFTDQKLLIKSDNSLSSLQRKKIMRSVIEFSDFIQKTERQFSAEEREQILTFLSENPKAGKTVENFGGIRKLEWHQKRRRGDIFNIYFHPGSNNLPLVIVSLFKKGEKLIFNKVIEILIHDKVDSGRQ